MNENEFRDRVMQTLRNAAGKRELVDHVRKLLPEIEAFRMDGVPWLFIAAILYEIREGPDLSAEALENYCGQVRKAYSKGRRKSREVTGGRDPPVRPMLAPPPTTTRPLVGNTDEIERRATRLQSKEK